MELILTTGAWALRHVMKVIVIGFLAMLGVYFTKTFIILLVLTVVAVCAYIKWDTDRIIQRHKEGKFNPYEDF